MGSDLPAKRHARCVIHTTSLEELPLTTDSLTAIVQLAHPGRMSPRGAGGRPSSMPSLCPSVVPVILGDSWLDKKVCRLLLGVPVECTLEQIDEVVSSFVLGARVALRAGWAGVQLHAAHGFLLSQFLSPHTNRREDDYGGSPTKRLFLLQRIVREIRAVCPAPFCLAVKLNSGDCESRVVEESH